MERLRSDTKPYPSNCSAIKGECCCGEFALWGFRDSMDVGRSVRPWPRLFDTQTGKGLAEGGVSDIRCRSVCAPQLAGA